MGPGTGVPGGCAEWHPTICTWHDPPIRSTRSLLAYVCNTFDFDGPENEGSRRGYRIARTKGGGEEVDVECWRWKMRERVKLMWLPHICEVDVVAWKERVQRSNRKLIQHV